MGADQANSRPDAPAGAAHGVAGGAAEAPRAISARNVLEGEIAVITQEESGSHLVELSTGAGTVLSRLTGEAVQELGLARGKRAWALVKAHAV